MTEQPLPPGEYWTFIRKGIVTGTIRERKATAAHVKSLFAEWKASDPAAYRKYELADRTRDRAKIEEALATMPPALHATQTITRGFDL